MPAEIVIIANVWITEENLPVVLDLLKEDVEYTHDNEPDVKRFALHRDTTDPLHFTMVEAFPNQAALDAHRASPFYASLMERLDGLIDRRDRLVLEPMGFGDPVKGYLA